MVRTYYGDYGGVARNDYARATKTKRSWWFDYWESWEMFGIQGNDTLIGGPESDSLYGGAGNDWLRGEDGSDYLDGNSGNDTMVGGNGHDTYRVDSYSDVVSERDYGGFDTIRTTTSSYRLPSNVEALVLETGYNGYGNSQGNTITGNHRNNKLYGYAGQDRLIGNDGNDTLDGGLNRDTMQGGNGNDVYYVDNRYDIVTERSGEGIDTVHISLDNYQLPNYVESLVLEVGASAHGNSLSNAFYGSSGSDSLYGNNGNDTLFGAGGFDDLYGGAGNDNLYGGDQNDELYGEAGRDWLFGGAGSDDLYGSVGNDDLYGGAGTDYLDGFGHTSEYDTLSGDSEADIFVLGSVQTAYYRGAGYATVTDFNRAEGDKIWVNGSPSDYVLVQTHLVGSPDIADTRILLNGDVIGIVQDNTTIALNTDIISASVIVD